MSIDGIGGPKGPGDVSGPKGIERTEGVEKPELAREQFSIDEAQGATPAAETSFTGDATVIDAVNDIALDVRTGSFANLDAAFSAVVDRIVETRYPGMDPHEQRRLSRSLFDMLSGDPGVGAALRDMLERAVGQES